MTTLVQNNMKTWKISLVLVGFPVVSYLLSTLLLHREIFSSFTSDFFNVFWPIIILWYIIQFIILKWILQSSGWTFKDIGYRLNRKGTLWLVAGFVIFSGGLLWFVQFALEHNPINEARLNDLDDLYPPTVFRRVLFIIMAFWAGITEELVYRGFAIRSLQSRGINKWLAVVMATVPFIFQHGIKWHEHLVWFGIWGIVFGVIFVLSKRLLPSIIIHFLVGLSAVVAVLQVIES